MDNELLFFNGIDATTGQYLVAPVMPDDLGRVALGEKLDEEQLSEYRWRKAQQEEAQFALKFGLDPQNLAEAGWGVIFPAQWDEVVLNPVREALSELLSLRKSQAGARYREFIGGDGYRSGESKNDFLVRHGAAPGPVDPDFVPYYLLIVGDPEMIPFRFQYELDVAYLVGRIHFETQQEYAQYARSVITAETPGAIQLARRASFFGVANPGDKATQLSAEMLISPMVEQLRKDLTDWDLQLIPPDEAYKPRLLDLVGGKDTPALLFTASHGMGFPNGDARQHPFQGALLCQDWPGPGALAQEVDRNYYLGGEDIPSDANLLGLVSFHFACFGAGTPRWDDYAKQAFKTRAEIAPGAFLAALPKRLLSHPRGGALAVIGHVDRAWTYSFKWGGAGSQTLAFQDVVKRMAAGETVGSALDVINSRYAEISTLLSNELEEAEYKKPDLFKLAGYWTANNDARGYGLLGDPAVRLPVSLAKNEKIKRPEIAPVEIQPGAAILAQESAPAQEKVAAPVLASAPATAADFELAQDFMLGADTLKQVRDGLNQTLQILASRLSAFVENVTSLDVTTYVSETMEEAHYDRQSKTYTGGAVPRAMTHISLDGDTKVLVPFEAGEVDEAVWEVHVRMVEQALENRNAMIKTAAEILSGFIPKL